MQNELHAHADYLVSVFAKGFIGTIFPLLGVLSSFQENLEWSFRMGSLVIGMTVGIFTLRSLVKSKRKMDRSRKKPHEEITYSIKRKPKK